MVTFCSLASRAFNEVENGVNSQKNSTPGVSAHLSGCTTMLTCRSPHYCPGSSNLVQWIVRTVWVYSKTYTLNIKCTLHTVHYTLHTAECIMCNIKYTLSTVYSTLNTAPFTLHTKHFTYCIHTVLHIHIHNTYTFLQSIHIHCNILHWLEEIWNVTCSTQLLSSLFCEIHIFSIIVIYTYFRRIYCVLENISTKGSFQTFTLCWQYNQWLSA